MVTQQQDPVSYRVALKLLNAAKSEVFLYVAGYLALFGLAYLLGKLSAQSFSKYASSLLKQKKKLAKVQQRMHQLRTFKSWILRSIFLLCMILAGSIFYAIYLKFGTLTSLWHHPIAVVKTLYSEWSLQLALISSFIGILVLVKRGIVYWQRGLVNDQEETKHTKDNFIKSLLHELGDDITDSLFMSIGHDQVKENKALIKSLLDLKETANKDRREIIVKNTFIDSYVDFMQSIGSFKWCSNCMTPLIGKSLRASPSGANLLLVSEESANTSPNGNLLRQNTTQSIISEHGDSKTDTPTEARANNQTKPLDKPAIAPLQVAQGLQRSSSFLVCHSGCLSRYLRHVEQLKKKMKEQHAEVAVLDKQLEATLKNQILDDIEFDDPSSKD